MLTPSMGGAIPFGVLCSMDVSVTPSQYAQDRTELSLQEAGEC